MFENTIKCLNEYENALEKCRDGVCTYEEVRTYELFEMHLAEALITDKWVDTAVLANILLAVKNKLQ